MTPYLRSIGVAAFLGLTYFTACSPADVEDERVTGTPLTGTLDKDDNGLLVNELITLDTCTTSIAADVPEFFHKYFMCATITMDGQTVVIKSNGVPPHESPYFADTHPNWVAFDTMGGTRQKNPNELVSQSLTISIPVSPVAKGLIVTDELVDGMAATSAEEYRGAPLGMSLNGVAMFHGVAAPGDDISVEEKTFDHFEGHPERTGMYHYHNASRGPMEVLKKKGLATQTTPGAGEIELFALMCDGTLVLGCVELNGAVPVSTDLDGQNGHVHDIADSAGVLFTARYHTHLCRGTFNNTNYSPEIQYYSTCGNGGMPPR